MEFQLRNGTFLGRKIFLRLISFSISSTPLSLSLHSIISMRNWRIAQLFIKTARLLRLKWYIFELSMHLAGRSSSFLLHLKFINIILRIETYPRTSYNWLNCLRVVMRSKSPYTIPWDRNYTNIVWELWVCAHDLWNSCIQVNPLWNAWSTLRCEKPSKILRIEMRRMMIDDRYDLF